MPHQANVFCYRRVASARVSFEKINREVQADTFSLRVGERPRQRMRKIHGADQAVHRLPLGVPGRSAAQRASEEY